MKFTLLAAVAASAAFVSASPISLLVVSHSVQSTDSSNSPHHDPLAHVRIGFAPANPIAHLMRPGQAPDAKHRPCGGRGSRFRQKAVEISNRFRKMFGFPLIEPHHKFTKPGSVHILPFIGTPPSLIEIGGAKDGHEWNGNSNKQGDRGRVIPVSNLPHPRPDRPKDHPPPPHHDGHHHHHHHHAHHGHHGHKFGGHGGFGTRVYTAIMSLGQWEGIAVSFVLGCGIGVLLRMFWVLVVLAYRSVRGDSSDHEYTHITNFEHDDEDDDEPRRRTPLSAPPVYIYPVDEKVALEVQAEVAPKTQQPEESN